MRSIEDMLDEIENANQGAGPDPHTTINGAGLKAITDAVSRREQAEDAIEAAVARALATPPDALNTFAPQLGILSARHESQYSRLFRS